MIHRSETEVLIVGAGPVGMLTALLLAEEGIGVEIIDKEESAATRSYACALHPQTLKIFDRVGLAPEILRTGRRIETVAFYDGSDRCGEVRLAELPGDFPFAVVLPQSVVEGLLEGMLSRSGRVNVNWSHRLSRFSQQGSAVVATVDEMCQTSKGYSVPKLDWEVKRTRQINASFLVGADGCESLVRQQAGIEFASTGAPEAFAVFEFESDWQAPAEVRVVLDDRTSNVLWPLANNRARWSFQVPDDGAPDDSRAKDRSPAVVIHPSSEDDPWRELERFIRERAPWFQSKLKEVDWCPTVRFEHRVATPFGRDRCWLVGDAAHQTGPVGMQSMNVGFREAEDLARTLARVIRGKASGDALENFNRERHTEWEQLLGIKGGLKPNVTTPAWARQHASRLLSCLPASGEDLVCLVRQLGLGEPQP